MFEGLFDFENDFTEEEEAVFAPKGTQTGRFNSSVANKANTPKTVAVNYGTGRTIEMKIVDDYKDGVTVSNILSKYGLSTGRLYDILRTYDIPLRVQESHIFISEVASRFNLTDANIRGYCQILEKGGYTFARISKEGGRKSARIFTEEDIQTIGRMIDNMRKGFSMVESAALASYNPDTPPPKVTVKQEGDNLYITIDKAQQWTADEINVVINLAKGEK